MESRRAFGNQEINGPRDRRHALILLIAICLTILFGLTSAPPAKAAFAPRSGIAVDAPFPVFDRINRQYVIYPRLYNGTTEPLAGPTRIVIESSSIPVVDRDGTTSAGEPYFVVSDAPDFYLGPSEHSLRIRMGFELQRRLLTHTFRVETETPNTPPTADAGADQTPGVGETITLDASASYDADGDVLNYLWHLDEAPEGSRAELSDIHAVRPTIDIDAPGRYVVSLIVDDGSTASESDHCVVDTRNSAPVADAGPDRTAHVGDTVSLDGTASSDVDGDPLAYAWTPSLFPADSTAFLSDPAAPQPWLAIDRPGEYVFDLVVSDGLAQSAPDQVRISTANSAPLADAGADQTVTVSDTVILDGSASSDPDNDPLAFTWSLTAVPAGSLAALDDPTLARPRFVIDLPGTYVGALRVGAGALESAPDTVTISTVNSRPVADAGPDIAVTTGTAAMLKGSASSDPDLDPLTFDWSLLAKPAASAAAVLDPDAPTPSLVPDLVGSYIAQLIVADGVLDSAPDTVVIEALAPPNRAPRIDALPAAEALAETRYSDTLVASDPDGDPLTFSLVQAPLGLIIDAADGTLSWTPNLDQIGIHVVEIQVTDPAGLSADARFDLSAQAPPNRPPRIGSAPPGDLHVGETLAWPVQAIDPDGDLVTYVLADGPAGLALDADSGLLTWQPSAVGNHPVEITAGDPAGLTDRQAFTLSVRAEPLPPAPETLAPPIEPAAPGRFLDRFDFLLDGPSPVQTGVEPGAIATERAAVLRGRVLATDGSALAGVRVAIQGAPELGQTLTRADGVYDLVVNGGRTLVLDFTKPGYLPVQRPVEAPWEAIISVPEARLTRLDPIATRITFSDPDAGGQVARGSRIDDGDGVRQATVLFPPGVGAELVYPDGRRERAAQLTIRATEYTVGPDGPTAMPGALPVASGYTYAVELGADEAIANGAGRIDFDRPLALYVENFLGFPVGTPVPVGWYDRERAVWVPSDDGLVIALLTPDAQGRARIDLDGSGTPATADELAALGIDAAERGRLAGLYAPGTELWRSPITHFTPWDCNWPWTIDSEDPRRPEEPPEREDEPPEDEEEECGSRIGTSGGWVAESIPVAGTGLRLNYDSRTSAAFRGGSRIHVPLTGSDPPPGLRGVSVSLSVGGHRITRDHGAGAGQAVDFPWSGHDAYGRPLQAPVTGTVQVCYRYGMRRLAPGESLAAALGWRSGFGGSGDGFGGSRTGAALALATDRAGREARLCSSWSLDLAGPEQAADTAALGGWSLSGVHALDPKTGRFTRGDRTEDVGSQRRAVLQPVLGAAPAASPSVADTPTAAGTTVTADPPAAETSPIDAFALGADGRVLVAHGGTLALAAPGGPATPLTLAAGPNLVAVQALTPVADADGAGRWYLLARAAGDAVARLWQLAIIDPDAASPQATLTALAGNGTPGCLAESSPTLDALLTDPTAIAASGDGQVYLADAGCHRVYRLRTDGRLVRHAGTGADAHDGDEDGARSAAIGRPRALALGPNGDLYIGAATSAGAGIVRRVEPSGFTTTVAGRADGPPGFAGDGGPATAAQLGPIGALAAAAGGTLYIDDSALNHRVRALLPDDRIITVAGNGDVGSSIAGALPTHSPLGDLAGLALGPDDALYLAERGGGSGTGGGIHRLAPPARALPVQGEILLPEGGLVHVFDRAGRHLAERDAVTGTELRRFAYDADGQLTAIHEPFGRTTTIERDADAITVTAPDGQRTAIALDAAGRLTQVQLPEGATYTAETAADGTLTAFGRPGTDPTRLTYDAAGRLITDTNPAGGGWRISRTRGTRLTESRFESAAGRIRRSARQRGDGAVIPDVQTSTGPDGLAAVTAIHPDGSVTTQAPDGTATETRYAAHPLWGWAARYASLSRLTTPAGRTLETLTRLQAEQADPSDPFSLASLTRTTTEHGRTWRAVYDAATRTETATSPAGRTAATVYDQWLRPVREATPGRAPVRYAYDDSPAGGGRLIEIVQGDDGDDPSGQGADPRRIAYGYDADGHLATITDPMGRVTQITNDALGRPVSATTPDGRTRTLAYDDAGNLIALTPPGRPAHEMEHDARGRETRYDPPALADANGIGGGGIDRAYNADGDPIRTAHDDGPAISLHYDAGFDPEQPPSDTNRADGRLWRIEAPSSTIDVAYDSTGKIQSLATADGETLTFTRDGPLPITETAAGSVNATLAFDYDADFNLAAETLSTESGSSWPIDYGYDADGLLTEASAEGRTLTLSRDADNGALIATALGAITTEHGYNPFGEPESFTALYGADTLFEARYTRDNLGRITEIEETLVAPEPGQGGAAPVAPPVTRTFSFTYDAADRLQSCSLDGAVQETHGYDPNGNRTHVDGTEVATYDDQDRLVSYTPIHPRPIPTAAIGYRIDPQHRRIARTEDGQVTHLWVYRDDLNPIAELNPDGSLKSLFIYADQANTPPSSSASTQTPAQARPTATSPITSAARGCWWTSTPAPSPNASTTTPGAASPKTAIPASNPSASPAASTTRPPAWCGSGRGIMIPLPGDGWRRIRSGSMGMGRICMAMCWGIRSI